MSFWESLVNLFFGSKPTAPAPPPPIPIPIPLPPIGGTTNTLFQEHNKQRALASVLALTQNQKLDAAAQLHANWMAANRKMDHVEDQLNMYTFADRIRAQGYLMSTGGENIAAGQRTVDEVMYNPKYGWMNSAGHRANILNPKFAHVGFGVAFDRYNNLYWCTVFATPLRGTVRLKHVVQLSLPEALVSRNQ